MRMGPRCLQNLLGPKGNFSDEEEFLVNLHLWQLVWQRQMEFRLSRTHLFMRPGPLKIRVQKEGKPQVTNQSETPESLKISNLSLTSGSS